MNKKHFLEDRNFQQLVDAWRDSDLSNDQAETLSRILRESNEARRVFAEEARLHGLLHCAVDAEAIEQSCKLPAIRSEYAVRPLRVSTSLLLKGFVAVVACLLVAIGATGWLSTPARTTVALLASSEHAAWESALPTTTGSQLEPGILHLKSGVASIQFHSGATVLLEAPASLELVTSMRSKIYSGAAVIDVPDTALGFIMETPDGYAIDYGTRFAVRVDPQQRQSDFEIIEGEIAVHHPSSGEEVRLVGEGRAATVSPSAMVITDPNEHEKTLAQSTRLIRVETNGRCGSALRNNQRVPYIHHEFLAVKRTNKGKWDYRSFFSFDLSHIDLETVEMAQLWLNLLPSTRGLASRLPKINRFGIYGLTNPAKEDWQVECLWDDSPGPEDGVRLGTFEVPRSLQRGRFGIEGEPLLKFLRENRGGPVTLILVRETTKMDGVGNGLTHLFASDQHPEAVGPLLELTVK